MKKPKKAVVKKKRAVKKRTQKEGSNFSSLDRESAIDWAKTWKAKPTEQRSKADLIQELKIANETLAATHAHHATHSHELRTGYERRALEYKLSEAKCNLEKSDNLVQALIKVLQK